MSNSNLYAVSPVDGRYGKAVGLLREYYSEYALIRYRIRVEVEYFIALCELPLPQLACFDKSKYADLRGIYENYDEATAERVKAIESVTNHDVKAVEYLLKERFEAMGIAQYSEFIHFGLTSQDINNTATPLLHKEAMAEVYAPVFDKVLEALEGLVEEFKERPMLARTHGQPASPTRLGKEFGVFVERLRAQYGLLRSVPHSAKFGGATGNFNAHNAAYPGIDWKVFANNFVAHKLGLSRLQLTTQIEHYDNFAAQCDALRRINNILIDLCRDIWTYISMDYFKQKIKKDEVGSSAMPHKVNPIDFENAEGNFGMANAILEHLSNKLPISRMQRDLTDSTVLRNIGVPVGHTLIAMGSLLKGLNKLLLNGEAMDEDLRRNWMVVAEGVQTILRREGFPKPYEALKALTRTAEKIDKAKMDAFIDGLAVSDAVKEELKALSPFSYTGI